MAQHPENTTKAGNRKPILLFVWHLLYLMFTKREKITLVGLILCLFVTSVMEITGMLFLFAYIGGLSGGGGRSAILLNAYERIFGEATQLDFAIIGGACVVLVFLIKNIASMLIDFAFTKFLARLYQRAVRIMLSGYLHQRYELLKAEGISNAQFTIMRCMNLFNSGFGSSIQVFVDIILILVILALLFAIDFGLTIGAILLFGVFGVGQYAATRSALVRLGRTQNDMNRESSQTLAESFGGLIDARLNARIDYHVNKMERSIHRLAMVNRRRELISRIPRAMNEVTLAIGIVFVVLYYAFFGQSINSILPTLALFGFAGMRLVSSLARLSANMQVLVNQQDNFHHLYDSLDKIAPMLLGKGDGKYGVDDYAAANQPLPTGKQAVLDRAIRANNLTFTYPGSDEAVIKDVSLTIHKGQFIGFCGPSGGGKSTLSLLLMGLMKPDSGQILCDEWQIQQHILSWFQNIGHVDQRPFVSRATIRENVAFGLWPDEIEDDKVWHALDMAQLKDFVKSLPKQLDTEIGDDGDLISGGQRQRLVIARALYNDPDILFLDEATSALDNVTEREFTTALNSLSGSKTIICIAHRLSTIRQADTIYLMKDGVIQAQGSYDELLETSPEFNRLATI